MAAETILITGASSGIGRELAKCFAEEGCQLILVARSEGPLKALAADLRQSHQIEAHVFPADLSLPETPICLFANLEAKGLQVDVLVNNAGFGAQGPFAELSLERQLKMIQVNVTALTHLTRLFLPGMIERRRGGIINVASTAAFQPGPLMAVYYATKAFVLSFSEAIAEELRESDLTVTALCPGPTHTNFFVAAGMRNSRLLRMKSMSAEAVARIGHRAFRQGRHVSITGLRNQLAAFSVRLAPRSLVRKIVHRINIPLPARKPTQPS
jgi:short-subunit dehydrogenase